MFAASAELAPVFEGSVRLLDEFLSGVGIMAPGDFDAADRLAAFSGWARYVTARRASKVARRPIADVLIGAHALQHEGIITRNGTDFRSLYPKLRIV